MFSSEAAEEEIKKVMSYVDKRVASIEFKSQEPIEKINQTHLDLPNSEEFVDLKSQI